MSTSAERDAHEPQNGIPLCIPAIQGNEWQYLKACLDTGWVSSVGAFVDRFEQNLADYVGATYAVATTSGTAALHVALQVAGVATDDEVLVSTLTFIAPVNAIRYLGAWPVFIDAEPDYWQMDVQRIEDFLTQSCQWRDGALYNRTTGRRVRAILPVHILGHPVDMNPISDLAARFALPIIEDATESLGANYRGRKVGTMGTLGCFSFNGNKLITTGGGGMVVTDDEALARRVRYLTTQAKDDAVEFIHGEVGYNYRLTNIQAALGCAQLEQIEQYITAKRHIAARYAEALGKVAGITCMREASWATSVYWMYTIMVDPLQYGMDSRALLRQLGQVGIQTRPLWQPIHRSPAYAGIAAPTCEVAEQLNRDGLSLPCSVNLTDAEQQRVIRLVTASQRHGDR